jgi:hypothetical protein
LFGCQYLDPTGGEDISNIGAVDVPVKGNGVELGQNGDFVYPGMKTIAHRNVDEPVFAS